MFPVFHDMRSALFLIIALAMLLFICAIAALGAVTRPVRWSERKAYR
jgi:hypothetical protein